MRQNPENPVILSKKYQRKLASLVLSEVEVFAGKQENLAEKSEIKNHPLITLINAKKIRICPHVSIHAKNPQCIKESSVKKLIFERKI